MLLGFSPRRIIHEKRIGFGCGGLVDAEYIGKSNVLGNPRADFYMVKCSGNPRRKVGENKTVDDTPFPLSHEVASKRFSRRYCKVMNGLSWSAL